METEVKAAVRKFVEANVHRDKKGRFSGVSTSALKQGIEDAKINRRGYVQIPGVEGRPLLSEARAELDERGEEREAPRVMSVDQIQEAYYPGWNRSADDGAIVDLELGAKCSICGEEIESEKDRKIVTDKYGRLADAHASHFKGATVEISIEEAIALGVKAALLALEEKGQLRGRGGRFGGWDGKNTAGIADVVGGGSGSVDKHPDAMDAAGGSAGGGKGKPVSPAAIDAYLDLVEAPPGELVIADPAESATPQGVRAGDRVVSRKQKSATGEEYQSDYGVIRGENFHEADAYGQISEQPTIIANPKPASSGPEPASGDTRPPGIRELDDAGIGNDGPMAEVNKRWTEGGAITPQEARDLLATDRGLEGAGFDNTDRMNVDALTAIANSKRPQPMTYDDGLTLATQPDYMNDTEKASASEEQINDAVNSVWQSFKDDDLRNMTRANFLYQLEGLDLSNEDQDEAWEQFKERRDRVTADNGWIEKSDSAVLHAEYKAALGEWLNAEEKATAHKFAGEAGGECKVCGYGAEEGAHFGSSEEDASPEDEEKSEAKEDASPEDEEKSEAKEGGMRCSACGHVGKPDGTSEDGDGSPCPECGGEMVEFKATCPDCGASMKDDACPECGWRENTEEKVLLDADLLAFEQFKLEAC